MNYTNDITGKTIETKTQTSLQVVVLQARLASTPSDTLIQVAEGQAKGTTAASQLQLGQIIKAQIILQPEQNQISLQLGKVNIQIPLSDTASIKQEALLQQIALLTAGKEGSRPLQLLLEVIQTQPKLELRVQSPNPTPTSTTNSTASTNTPTPVDNAIKNLIATQRGLAPLLANLVQLTKASNLPQIPTNVLQEARALLENLATVARASTADGVKQSLQNSGAFLEAKIANQLQVLQNHPSTLSSSLQSDLKGTLLRFQQLLTNLFPSASAAATAAAAATTANPALPSAPLPQESNNAAPPLRGSFPQPQAAEKASMELASSLQQIQKELLTQTDSSLARIRLVQLANVPDGDQRMLWMMEMPIKHGDRVDVFQIRMERERSQSKDKDAEHTWTIHLAFDLQELGPVHAQVRLRNRQVSTLFWANNANTLSLINQQSNLLIDALRKEGLEVNSVVCQQGSPPRNAASIRARSILDERA